MTTTERRASPRVRRYHLVAFTHYDDEGGIQNQGLARTLDLSCKGLLFETTNPPDPRDRIILELQIGDEVLCLEGQVIHVELLPNQHYSVGVSWPEIPADIMARIEREVGDGSVVLPDPRREDHVR